MTEEAPRPRRSGLSAEARIQALTVRGKTDVRGKTKEARSNRLKRSPPAELTAQ